MSHRCKFVDGQGEPIGWADVSPMYGVVNVNGRYYGRMFNGDEDKDKFPFIFADADVMVLGQLEELKYEHEKRKRPADAAGTDRAGSDNGGRLDNRPKRRDQLKAQRGRSRGSY